MDSIKNNVIFTHREVSSVQADVFVNFIDYKGSMRRQAACVNTITDGMSDTALFKMEQYCRRKARAFTYIPSFIIGKKPGDFFTSPSFGLNCSEIVHIVSTIMPCYSMNEKIVITFLNSVFRYCRSKNYKTAAIPLFAIRNYEFEPDYTYKLIQQVASVYPELQVTIVE